MEREKPSDFPREPLDLFSQYRHGHIDRRSFLDGARRFAVSGLTVGAVFEMMRPNYAWAQVGKETHPAPPAFSISSEHALRSRSRSTWPPCRRAWGLPARR